MSDLVSIIIPTYNYGHLIHQCIESVINQTYTNWECIIVDDGSTDNTENIVLKLILEEKKIQYIKTINNGVSFARNIGIEKANGSYILTLDSDDKISSTYVEACIKLFKENDNVKIAYSKAEFIGDKKGVWNLRKSNAIDDILFINNIYNAAIYKKKDWKKVGGYDINMKYGYEDWEFWINLLKKGGVALKTENATFYYRIKNKSRTSNITKHYSNLMRNYIYNKHFELYEEKTANPIHLYLEKKELELYLNHIHKNPFRFLIKRILGKNK